jgi:hypothetical protein
MANFVIGEPVSTAEATVLVDTQLAPGFHRFRLEVVNERGTVSPADEAVVEVTGRFFPGDPVEGPVLTNPEPIDIVPTRLASPPRRPRRRPK